MTDWHVADPRRCWRSGATRSRGAAQLSLLSLPELIFNTDARPVTSDEDRTLDNQRFHNRFPPTPRGL
jgi:hypothetical protein